MVAGAALEAPLVVAGAGIGGPQIPAAHGEHGLAAVAAKEKAGVYVVVDLDAPVAGGAALLPRLLGQGEGPVIQDGLVVVFKDDVVALVLLPIRAVDLLPGVLALAQGANVEVVFQDALYSDDAPLGPGLAL